MKTRAKFVVGSVTPSNDTWSVVLSPVISGSTENESFYKWTPGGSIVLSVLSEATAQGFIVGKEYYVDFSEAS